MKNGRNRKLEDRGGATGQQRRQKAEETSLFSVSWRVSRPQRSRLCWLFCCYCLRSQDPQQWPRCLFRCCCGCLGRARLVPVLLALVDDVALPTSCSCSTQTHTNYASCTSF